MVRKLTPRSSLDALKREAKRWLHALRDGDPAARARLAQALPAPPPAPTLRDVQLALAREHGLAGWTALRDALAAPADDPGHAERVRRFVRDACPDHEVRGAQAHVVARGAAERLRARHPEIARDGLVPAAICGDVDAVARALAGRPAAANEPTGPTGWTPLLHVCFTRLDVPAEDHVAVARLLLDHGADPNAYFMAGDSRYTPLVGVYGEGEEERPPHAARDALAELLLERGAEPYDVQVTYDVHFRGDVLGWLRRMHAHALRLGRAADWADPEWRMLDMSPYGWGARWHLDLAIERHDAALAEWCLTHGASPEATPARDPRRPRGTPHEAALRHGATAIAELLVRHGARPSGWSPAGEEAFVLACRRGDREAAAGMARAHPEWLARPTALHAAARADDVDAVALLLDLGASIEAADGRGARALHVAALHAAERVAALLLARGAEVDPVERVWSSTPLGIAVWFGHARLIALLAPVSRNPWGLAVTGHVDRLRAVVEEEPALARTALASGWTLLMWLPDDEARALAVVELLLAHGADAAMRNDQGETAAEIADRRGMDAVAARLRAAGG